MRIREAVIEDAEALTALARLSKASWGYPEAWLTEWESDLRITREYIETHLVFVMEEEGHAIGMVSVEVADEGPEIGHCWVAPGAQGRGAGRALIDEVRRVARDRGWALVRVISDPNAQAFYERMGAVQVGEVDAPVGGTDRTLPLMSLPV